jgi:ankyrin repeat protein
VEKGADLEIANRHGHTCLMIACYKGHQKIVRYLLERGADVNRKSLKGTDRTEVVNVVLLSMQHLIG